MSSVWITSNLSSWCSVQIDYNVHPSIAGPSADLLQILKSALRKVFAVRIYKIFANPIAHGDTNSVEAERLHLSDVVLRGPSAPMLRPRTVRGGLSELTDTIEFGFCATATHFAPFIACHPGLDNELRTQIHPTNLSRSWERTPGHVMRVLGHPGRREYQAYSNHKDA